MSNSELFKVYKASAGSGKTFMLAKEYLRLALLYPAAFEHILAVTFTNKATQEMKERIIKNLADFSSGEKTPMGDVLCIDLSLDYTELKKRSTALLHHILHDYSRFSVQTIDTFFQKVIRAFARELSISIDGELVLDSSEVQNLTVDLLMEDLSKNPELQQWILDFSIDKLEDKGKWDVRKDILEFSYNLLKDDFRKIEEALFSEPNLHSELKKLRSACKKQMAFFRDKLNDISVVAQQHMLKSGFTIEDFSYGKSGAIAVIFKIGKEKADYDANSLFKKRFNTVYDSQGEDGLVTKKSKNRDQLINFYQKQIHPLFEDVKAHYDSHYKNYKDAEQISSNLYLLGISIRFLELLREYKREEGIQFLSDTNYFLKDIIASDEGSSPFIYEKMGSFYNHFLIDEFQDTSSIQWDNFKPLIEDSLASNHYNLVVGDIKQSIYRWRGGDWRLLLSQLKSDLHDYYGEAAMSNNYRSKINIVEFNNFVFTELPEVLVNHGDSSFIEEYKSFLKDLEKAYPQEEVSQIPNQKNSDSGYVKIRRLHERTEAKDGMDETWTEAALSSFVVDFERLQDQGVPLGDIGILVRTKNDGRKIIDYINQYLLEKPSKLQDYQYTIISDESLFLQSSYVVSFLLNCFRLLYEEDDVSNAQVKYFYNRLIHQSEKTDHHIFYVGNHDDITNEVKESFLPEEFLAQKEYLLSLNVYELAEHLIQLFQLNKISREKGYLIAFQDVLLEFGNRGGISDFLDWWEQNHQKYTVKLHENANSARMMTVHKSKGLEFNVCMIPLLNWNLSHGNKGPLHWVQSKGIFNTAIKYLPIPHSKSLMETSFEEYYYREELNAYLDNLNTLYVAFTRAAEILIVNVNAKANKSKIDMQLMEVLEKHSNWDDESDCLEIGDFDSIKTSNENSTETEGAQNSEKGVTLHHYESHSWDSKLAIKKSSTLEIDESGLSKVDFGIYVHDILSKLQDIEQLEELLNKLQADASLTRWDKEKISKIIKSNLSQKSPLLEWFKTDWKVKTEVPILLSDGSLIRIDRLLVKDNSARILDFKTGLQSTEYDKQLNFYRKTLRNMGFEDVKAYIAYLSDEVVIEEVN